MHLNTFSAGHQKGVTLIELAVGLAIFAVVLALAAPSFSAWIQNTQVRGAAESILNGLQVARNEALRRNTNVEFTLGAGSSWTVFVPSTGETVQEHSTEDGAKAANLDVSTTPGGSVMVTFSGLGRVVGNSNASPVITWIDVDSAVLPASVSKEMRILVNVGGGVKMCDPNPAVPSTDPRYCA
jgi:type IV fimbrial biogenesis protein FimT